MEAHLARKMKQNYHIHYGLPAAILPPGYTTQCGVAFFAEILETVVQTCSYPHICTTKRFYNLLIWGGCIITLLLFLSVTYFLLLFFPKSLVALPHSFTWYLTTPRQDCLLFSLFNIECLKELCEHCKISKLQNINHTYFTTLNLVCINLRLINQNI